MRIQTETRQVQTAGLTEENDTRAFTIKADAAMFKMLSSTLYTHKIRAVIRELTCNAWDAHQAAKRYDVPIEVHIPTHLEPYFEVKDYGKGLSHENVMKLFSTYGESTKQGSNREIGGFGIGSKSPFCYVDSFLVESRFGGVKSSYNAFIERNGSPSITLMGQQPMAEEELSGITVKMNASVKDVYEFEKDGVKVLSMFAKPEVKTNINLEKPEPVYANAYGYVLENSKIFSHDVFAVMGNVAYPIPSTVLDGTIYKKENGRDYNFRQVMSSYKTYVFPFAIGELEIAPSREQLSLTKDTQAQIINKLNIFIAGFIQERKEKLAVHKYPWQFLENLKAMKGILHIDPPNFKKASENIFYESDIKSEVRKRLNALSYKNTYENILEEIVPQFDTNNKITLKAAEKSGYVKSRGKLTWVFHFINANNRPYGLKTSPTLPIILLLHGKKEALDSESIKYKYFLKDNAMKGQDVYCVKLPYVDARFLRVFKRKMLHLPESQYVWFKDLPTPTAEDLDRVNIRVSTATVAAKEAGKPREYVVYDIRERSGSLFTGTHTRVVNPENLQEYKDLADGEVLYYLNFDKFQADYVNNIDYGKEGSGRNFLFSYWDDKQDKPQIFGLCVEHCKKVKDNPKFKPAEELFKGYFMEILSEHFYYPIDWSKSKQNIDAYGNGRGLSFKDSKQLTTDKDLLRYMSIIDRIGKCYHNYYPEKVVESIVEYAKRFDVIIPQSVLDKPIKNSQDDDKFLTDFFAKYPMFKLSAEVTDTSFKLYQDYYSTMKANQKRRK